MEFTETNLKGAYVVRLKRIEDERGYFARGWCRDEFSDCGLNANMAQLNVIFSHRRGTIRGMHFQTAPHEEAKFVRCTRGAIYDVIIDLRRDSPTFRNWHGIELTPENGLMVYAPPGFAHGCQALNDNSEIYYLASVPFSRDSAQGVRYDDPAFDIRWPLPVSIVSAADRSWPNFNIQGACDG